MKTPRLAYSPSGRFTSYLVMMRFALQTDIRRMSIGGANRAAGNIRIVEKACKRMYDVVAAWRRRLP